jgi:hypothetical protein
MIIRMDGGDDPIPDDEPCILVRASDPIILEVVRFYAYRSEMEGAPPESVANLRVEVLGQVLGYREAQRERISKERKAAVKASPTA